jgi:Ca-activated chloride channel homolog
MTTDHYSTLGVPYNATPEEIRSAYFQLARNLHPDVNPDPFVREQFIEVQKAYEVLSNPQKKARYDESLPAELRIGPEISVTAKYSRITLPCSREPQLVYALVELICTAEKKQDSIPPNHLCLVLDRSVSMNGARMDMIKSSAMKLLQQLKPHDFLSVVAFSDRAEVIIPPTRASAINKSDHRISLVQASGGTEILQGLTLGMRQLLLTDPSLTRQLVLLTDGHTYGDEKGCIQIAKEAAQEGIVITVLGIGHEWNDSLMDQIASMSGGNSMLISGTRELDNFVSQKLSDLQSIYARGMKFEFESSPGVELRYAFRFFPSIGPLTSQSPILLGDIHHRKSVTLLLEFLVPPLASDMDHLTLARGQINMEILGRTKPGARILIDLFRPVAANAEPETPPPVIVDALAKLTLYRMQERIRAEVSEGQIDKATKHLHYLATHLLSMNDRELVHAVLIEAEHVQQSRRFSGEGEKRIKYGTRALLLPSGLEQNK